MTVEITDVSVETLKGRLFDRDVRVTIARSDPASFTRREPNAVIITKLRVAFQVDKHTGSDPNTCTLTIFNLNQDTRAFLQSKPLHLTLEAGYVGRLKRLFVGDVRYANSQPAGPDWVTTIQVGDGDRAYNHARVDRAYKGGVDKLTLVRENAKAMGFVELPQSLEEASELLKQYSNGATLHGPARDEMTRVLKSANMDWSIQDGNLQIQRDSDVRPDEAWLISQETGMIGSPEFGTPSKAGENPTLTVRNHLYPEITPGGRIKVVSRAMPDGPVFKVTGVKHAGDTHGAEWSTAVESKSPGGAATKTKRKRA